MMTRMKLGAALDDPQFRRDAIIAARRKLQARGLQVGSPAFVYALKLMLATPEERAAMRAADHGKQFSVRA